MMEAMRRSRWILAAGLVAVLALSYAAPLATLNTCIRPSRPPSVQFSRNPGRYLSGFGAKDALEGTLSTAPILSEALKSSRAT